MPEADPTADVEGIDAGRKICILADLAFGHQVNPEKVPMEGITGLDLKDVEIAGHHGYRIKLLGRCLRLEGNRRTAYVAPHLISADNPISDVNDVFNAVVVRGNATGEVMFYGKGARGTAHGLCPLWRMSWSACWKAAPGRKSAGVPMRGALYPRWN